VRVVVAGGTGFIGRALCRRLAEEGMEPVALTRNAEKGKQVLGDRVTVAEWDARTPEGCVEWLENADAVVNLVGENIGRGRWDEEHRRRILGSRVGAVRAISGAMARARNTPGVFVQGSAVGYYGVRGDERLDETSAPGSGFLAGVVRSVEEAAGEIGTLGVRLVFARTGVVLGRGAGMLPRLVRPFRFFVGGPPGDGKQWIPWVHLEDEVGALRFLLERDDLEGPFNLTAPEPVRMRDFCRALGRAVRRPSWLSTPAFALRLLFGRDMADEVLLGGARVLPKRLSDAGYEYRSPRIEAALQSLL